MFNTHNGDITTYNSSRIFYRIFLSHPHRDVNVDSSVTLIWYATELWMSQKWTRGPCCRQFPLTCNRRSSWKLYAAQARRTCYL